MQMATSQYDCTPSDSHWHVLSFKGLERRVVVLCVNEDGTCDRSQERIRVGLSRPTDRLIVVGDLTAIAHACDEVVRELHGRR